MKLNDIVIGDIKLKSDLLFDQTINFECWQNL